MAGGVGLELGGVGRTAWGGHTPWVQARAGGGRLGRGGGASQRRADAAALIGLGFELSASMADCLIA